MSEPVNYRLCHMCSSAFTINDMVDADAGMCSKCYDNIKLSFESYCKVMFQGHIRMGCMRSKDYTASFGYTSKTFEDEPEVRAAWDKWIKDGAVIDDMPWLELGQDESANDPASNLEKAVGDALH